MFRTVSECPMNMVLMPHASTANRTLGASVDSVSWWRWRRRKTVHRRRNATFPPKRWCETSAKLPLSSVDYAEPILVEIVGLRRCLDGNELHRSRPVRPDQHRCTSAPPAQIPIVSENSSCSRCNWHLHLVGVPQSHAVGYWWGPCRDRVLGGVCWGTTQSTFSSVRLDSGHFFYFPELFLTPQKRKTYSPKHAHLG